MKYSRKNQEYFFCAILFLIICSFFPHYNVKADIQKEENKTTINSGDGYELGNQVNLNYKSSWLKIVEESTDNTLPESGYAMENGYYWCDARGLPYMEMSRTSQEGQEELRHEWKNQSVEVFFKDKVFACMGETLLISASENWQFQSYSDEEVGTWKEK